MAKKKFGSAVCKMAKNKRLLASICFPLSSFAIARLANSSCSKSAVGYTLRSWPCSAPDAGARPPVHSVLATTSALPGSLPCNRPLAAALENLDTAQWPSEVLICVNLHHALDIVDVRPPVAAVNLPACPWVKVEGGCGLVFVALHLQSCCKVRVAGPPPFSLLVL